MKSSYVVYLLALVALVHAQSAPQFPIKVDSSLAVEWTASSTRLRTGTVIERDSENTHLPENIVRDRQLTDVIKTFSNHQRSSGPLLHPTPRLILPC